MNETATTDTETTPAAEKREPHRRTRNTSTGVAQLSDAKVRALRLAYWVDGAKIADICREFGNGDGDVIPQSTIYAAARGASYKHIEMPDGSRPDAEDYVLPRRKKYGSEIVSQIRELAATGLSVPEISRTVTASAGRAVPQPYVRSILSGKFRKPEDEVPAPLPLTDDEIEDLRASLAAPSPAAPAV